MRLEEKEILNDCLVDAKFLSHGYHMAALESAHDQVRNAFIRMMNDEVTGAKMLFDAMHQRGWHLIDMVPTPTQPHQAAGQPRAHGQPGEVPPYYGGAAGGHPEHGTTPGMRPEQSPSFRLEHQTRPEAGYWLEGESRRW